jgi:hypothetical protein
VYLIHTVGGAATTGSLYEYAYCSWVDSARPFFKVKNFLQLKREAQLCSLCLLMEVGIDVRTQDEDGNYLATTLNVDPRASQLLQEMESGKKI